jgi:serine phosphatase RsbU (regulator of sigma subunit)
VALRKSTRIWLLLFVVSCVAAIVLGATQTETGCARIIAINLAIVAGLVLLVRGLVLAFRAIIRKLTLRLAFSYFLIGIVPIPLLMLLLFAGAYLVAHQIVATRVQREIAGVGREMAASPERGNLPAFEIDERGLVTSSDAPWLPAGSSAPWALSLAGPRPVADGADAWLVVPATSAQPRRFTVVRMTDPTFQRRVEQRTGYTVGIESGTSRKRKGKGFNLDIDDSPGSVRRADREKTPRPKEETSPANPASPDNPAGEKSLLDKRWVAGVYVDTPVAVFHGEVNGRKVVLYFARTSPRLLFDQLFAQGIPEVGRIFWGVFIFIGFSLLVVYLVALGIAFTLVGNLARNINRLTAASAAVARGDFSVRVNSKSRDQVGDLARSFDGMAASIEGLLVDTARKERLEAEIAIARTLQQKLLPPAEAELPGMSLRARFEPLAEIGGDYYDYARAPDGRSMVAIGDVSGHGLSTGLLVAMAKAGLSTLLESGFKGTDLFVKLNELIYRSTDSRNYMTLALLAYEPGSREATLTNAGQLAPYRISAGSVESLSLPSFPLGMSARTDFPTHAFSFAEGDRLVFLTDGIIEATDPAGDPFGFEKFEALLRAEAESTAAEIEAAVLSAVAAHTGGAPPEDDRTLVVVSLS